MQNQISNASGFKRPRLLVRAARLALGRYEREAVLARLLKGARNGPGAGGTMAELMALERAAETARKARDPAYRSARHVTLLTAIMAEAMGQPDQ